MTTTNPPAEAAPAPGDPAGTPASHWTVLVVDDEPDILGSIRLVLERSKRGVQVLTASSGAEGLEILQAQHVDLLISDFKMPGMDGIEFLARARALRPELPRVMFTAYTDAELARRAFAEAFVSDFLPKTLAPKELVAKVESLLGEEASPSRDEAASGQASASAGPDAEGVVS